jgi:hypothetical protein
MSTLQDKAIHEQLWTKKPGQNDRCPFDIAHQVWSRRWERGQMFVEVVLLFGVACDCSMAEMEVPKQILIAPVFYGGHLFLILYFDRRSRCCEGLVARRDGRCLERRTEEVAGRARSGLPSRPSSKNRAVAEAFDRVSLVRARQPESCLEYLECILTVLRSSKEENDVAWESSAFAMRLE